MKKIKILPLVLILTLVLVCLTPGALADEAETLTPPELQSAAAIIIDQDTGRELYSLNADEQRYPASLTKIMTVLLAVEAVDRGEVSLDDSVTAGDEAIQGMVEDGSTANIQVGETMSLNDLLYCAMLSSANEACNIIAVYIAGSLDAFVEDMNSRAEEIGCINTHFANTHGLPDSNHYTTARDFAKICRIAMANELFYNLSGTISYTVPATNMSAERQLSNSNGLINPDSPTYPGNYYEYARAGKTGHTTDAGYCLASMAERDGIGLVAVVLGGQMLSNDEGGYTYTNFTDSRTLYDWVFNNFSMQEVLGTTEIVTNVSVALAEDGGQAALRAQESISALLPNVGFDFSTIERDVTINSTQDGSELTAPIASGTVLGSVTLSLDNVVLGTSSLVTSSTIELARSEYMKQEVGNFFSNIWVQIIIVVLIVSVALYIWSVVRYRKLHKLHLQSLHEAEERAEQRYAEEEAYPEERYYTPAKPVEERTVVVGRTGAAAPPRDTGELEKTTVLTGVGRQAERPRETKAHSPAGTYQRPARSGVTPVRPAEPQQERSSTPRPAQGGTPPQRPAPSPQQRPAGSAGAPPAGDKARRDYFEEFFRNNGVNRDIDRDDKQ